MLTNMNVLIQAIILNFIQFNIKSVLLYTYDGMIAYIFGLEFLIPPCVYKSRDLMFRLGIRCCYQLPNGVLCISNPALQILARSISPNKSHQSTICGLRITNYNVYFSDYFKERKQHNEKKINVEKNTYFKIEV